MGHSDPASVRAASLQNQKADPFGTPEAKISELRKQRVARLAVTRYDFIDALLEEYDKEKAAVLHLGPATSALLIRAEKAEEQVLIVTTENQGLHTALAAAARQLEELTPDPYEEEIAESRT